MNHDIDLATKQTFTNHSKGNNVVIMLIYFFKSLGSFPFAAILPDFSSILTLGEIHNASDSITLRSCNGFGVQRLDLGFDGLVHIPGSTTYDKD